MTSSLRASAEPLAREYDVALLDLDGVVYVGAEAVPGAPAALSEARRQGLRLAFVTNNAARPPQAVADHLCRLGVTATTAEIITSAQAAARYLAERLPAGGRVLVVGTTGLTEALLERQLTPVSDALGAVDAVVQGYSPDMNWRLLAEGAIAINTGVPWVATNADPTVPSPRGPLPGNGSLVAALRLATGATPVITGKPDPSMHRESLLRSGAKHPIVVGDRLDTDVEGANAVGCASLLVFSGVTSPKDVVKAPPPLRPTYLAADVGGLLDAHAKPALEATGARCGCWRALVDGGVLRLACADTGATGSTVSTDGSAPSQRGDSLSSVALDALRALCEAWWSDPASDSAAEQVRGNEQAAADVRVAAADHAARAVLDELGIPLRTTT